MLQKKAKEVEEMAGQERLNLASGSNLAAVSFRVGPALQAVRPAVQRTSVTLTVQVLRQEASVRIL